MAITWSKEWAASDDGTIIKGADIKNIQDNIDAGIGDATKIQGKTVDAPVTADDGKTLYWDDTNQKFDYKDFTAVALATDGHIAIGDGTGDPTTLAAFISSTGVLKHEYGGLELDVSAITKGDLISASAAGVAALLNIGADSTVLTADSSEETGMKWGTGSGISFVSATAVSTSSTGNITISNANRYKVIVEFVKASSAGDIDLQFNASGGATEYSWVRRELTMATTPVETDGGDNQDDSIRIANVPDARFFKASFIIDTTARGQPEVFVHSGAYVRSATGAGDGVMGTFGGVWNKEAPTSFRITCSSGEMTGDIYVYQLLES